MKEMSAVVDGEYRKVRYAPYLAETELLKLIDDELYEPPHIDLQSRPDEYINDYVSRLRRFRSNIDYLLDSSSAANKLKSTRKPRPSRAHTKF